MTDSEHITAEEWRPVVGFPDYEISSVGRVRSFKRGGPRLLRLFGKPYDNVHLGRKILRSVHQLVAEAFIGPRPSGMEVCHNNGQHRDNRVENLRWDTRKANVADAIAHGTSLFPFAANRRSVGPKLTAEQVREIRAKWIPRKYPFSRLAKEYGVGKRMIEKIMYREKWAHIS